MSLSSLHTGLILSPPKPEHWTLGGDDPDINPSADYTDFRPADEAQSTPLFDSEGCALFGTGHALVTLAKFKGYDDFPKDISERHLGILSGTGPAGTDPHVVAEMIRVDGVIDAAILPWTDDLESFAEYYAPKPLPQVFLDTGRALLKKFTFGHKWVFAFGNQLTPKQKAAALKAALKKGTVCVSLDGDYRYKSGKLTKDEGAIDSHWVELLRFDGDTAVVFDQYAPFIKKLVPGYDHNAAKVYFLERNTAPQGPATFADTIITFFQQLWKKLNAGS